MAQIPFVTDSDKGRIPLNWYPAKDDEKGILMWGAPGLVSKVEAGNGPIRGMLRYGSYLYAVSGSGVYRINTSWTATLLGSIGTSTGLVHLACNGVQVMIVDGVKGYIVTISTGALSEITDSDFPIPSSLTYQDGYFIVTEDGSQSFYISSLLDGTAWDALDFASGEGAPDGVLRALMDHRELWIFGEETSDIFYNSGDSSFPFYRTQGGFIERGIAGTNAVAKLDNSLAWLDNLGMVVRANGYVPQVISTRKLEAEWSGFNWSNAEAFAYAWRGHWFFQLTFPDADDKTYVYDAATGVWHERAYGVMPNLHRDLATCYCLFNRKHLVGSRNDGNIFELRHNIYTHNTATITRLIDFPVGSANGKLVKFPGLQIELDHGKSGADLDPEAMLSWSDDGTNTWSNEHWAKIGKIGEYKARSRWLRLGSSRDRMFRLVITDAVSPTIKGFDLMQPAAGR